MTALPFDFDCWFETVEITNVQRKDELKQWLIDKSLTTKGALVRFSKTDLINQCSEHIGVIYALRDALESINKSCQGNVLTSCLKSFNR